MLQECATVTGPPRQIPWVAQEASLPTSAGRPQSHELRETRVPNAQDTVLAFWILLRGPSHNGANQVIHEAMRAVPAFNKTASPFKCAIP